jgi:hypothetical protein
VSITQKEQDLKRYPHCITINHYIVLCLTNIWIIKSRRRALQGHILDIEESRNACRISDVKPQGKTSPGRFLSDNTERDFNETGYDEAWDRDRW